MLMLRGHELQLLQLLKLLQLLLHVHGLRLRGLRGQEALLLLCELLLLLQLELHHL